MSIAVGDVLTRHDGREFRLVGIREGEFIAQPVEFDTLLTLTARDLAADFGIDNVEPSNPSDADDNLKGWQALDKAHLSTRGDVPASAQQTPEDVFAAASAAAKPKTRKRG